MINFFSANILSLIFFCAVIPFLLLIINYYAHKFFKPDAFKEDKGGLLRFSVSQRVIIAKYVGSGLILILLAIFLYRKIVLDTGSWSFMIFFSFFLYHLYIENLLLNFEKNKRLICDLDCNIYEYFDGSSTVVFSQSDILKIVVHQYRFKLKKTKIADIYLEDKVVRISNILVDFDRIPLLESKRVVYRNLFFKPCLPDLEVVSA